MNVRRRPVAAVLAGMVLLASCASEEEVETTQAALDQLAVDLGTMPGVADASADMDVSTGVPDPTMIEVFVSTTSEAEDEILEVIREVARASWHSDVPRLTGLLIDASPDGGAERYSSRDVFGALVVRPDQLEEEFGPREVA